MRARLLGFLGLGTTLAGGVGCFRGASDSNAGFASGVGGAPAPVYAPWGTGPATKDGAGLSGATSGTSSGAGGGDVVNPGAGGGSGTSTCPAAFQPTLEPVLLPYPAAKVMGAPALARGLLAAKQTPALGAVSDNEFLNYYRVQYAVSSAGIAVEAGLGPWLTPTEYVLQVGVQAPGGKRTHRVALTVIVDTSVTMAGESMDRAHAALVALAQGLQAGDTFALVTSQLGAAAPTRITAARAGDPAVLAQADALHVDFHAVDLGTALAKAYDAAATALDPLALQRVVLVTDGAALPASLNLGLVAGNLQARGITLSGVGVGPAPTYRSKLLDLATSVGSGASVYLDSKEEADTVLHQRFDELMDVAASDVDVTLTLPSFLQAEAPPTVAPTTGESPSGFVTSQLGPGRALVFRQVLRACAADLVDTSTSTITINARWKAFGDTAYTAATPVVLSTAALLHQNVLQTAKGSAIAAYADALRDPLRPARLHVAHDLASLAGLAGDADIHEILGLIESDPSYE